MKNNLTQERLEEALSSFENKTMHGSGGVEISCYDVLDDPRNKACATIEEALSLLQQAQTEAFNDGVEAAAIAVQESADDTFAGFGMVMKLEVDKEEVMRTFHKSQLQAVEAIQKLKKEVK